MFTGIVAGLGTVREIRPSGGGVAMAVEADFDLEAPAEGESIAVNGVCLTATTISLRRFTVDVSPETLERTTLGSLSPGARVNLERAVRLSDRLGGHLVSGHVDAVGTIRERRPLDRFTLFEIEIPGRLARYVIEKGSVAVDGISLTVNECRGERFSVAVIPHTARLTTMGLRRVGDKVNIEVDIIGKYIEKLMFTPREAAAPPPGLTKEMLARYGFA
ncbi:riboflavin synthase [Dissulfurirhabdus thermomarina]|uniref:Riboflavin synthase n=1 Tax=Dissulfurirhabdus thermomarina TaxID=1765737 RepID=A0A6N9TUE2_DISTH|nr:riboflavin synthase [Dissulfurirhabdus thermomarina]NDY43057.1 riboflavin synthase [Dissulfurirhabdus thermomarina]NMX22534.1 riboflavin synthase [Dissulfurirhabdus thermomarina]